MTSNGDQPPPPIPPQKRFAKFTFKKKGTAAIDHQNSIDAHKSPIERVPDVTTNPTAANYKPAPTISEQPLAEEGISWDR